ncbi:tetratricopeptide repeat protein [Antrihabitans cavernicola]|uniref:Tetratricopeptide repeat protein n=1 Tax=Antrihabitans cavernicola TaxID=2495913 RepID=A0A5A7SA71_9NOCA|nr:tetratricopeptide repeat protein [Spelaeibacter cavernicola]KAA0022816.1 tetratricopeptide repeat protein [Spelaeibacter cavernicola]
MTGAVDLSALKERAQPAQRPAGTAPSGADGPSAPAVVQVTEANFEAEVLQKSDQVPVVVAMVSGRSPGSLDLLEVLERIAVQDNGAWILGAVDVDANMRIAQAFGVQAIPTVVAVAAGQPLADFQGGQSDAQVRQWIDAVLAAVEGKLAGRPAQEGDAEAEAPEDPRFVAAEDALDSGDLDAAVAAYQKILDEEPANAQAKDALRQVQFLARAQTVGPDAVETADANPADVDAQLSAADAELLAQLPEAAFGRLIDAIKRTAGDDRTALRTRLLELFELFDPAEPFVVAARRKLATALY